VAADVGYGLLDLRLRDDPRVHVLDRTNVRTLDPELVAGLLGGPAEVVVADLSFISLVAVLPALAAAAAPGADLLPMVKPQFEVGRRAAGKGVVRDPALWAAAVTQVATAAAGLGLGVAGLCPSPRPGPAGNVEFFLHLRADAAALHDDLVAAATAEGGRLRPGGGA
jgi:23S rRNA (cytidine1920-2'-O)/16S rRNA (cytidine1409-2'-O)-methyltransferase